jgi:integrase
MPKQSDLIKHGSVTIKVNESVNRGRSLFFFNFYEGGRRHQRNFASKGAAQEEADTIARRLAGGHGAAISLTGRDRDAYLHAVHMLEGMDIPLSAAVEEYVAARKRLAGEPLADAVAFYLTRNPSTLPQRTVAEVAKEFLAAKTQDRLSERYLEDCRLRLDRFSKAFTGFIANIQANEIEDWLRALNVSPRTRNNFLGVIATMFSYARSRGYLRKSEKTEAEMVGKAKQRGGDIEIFTPEEFSKLLEHAFPSNLPAFLLGGLAGLRQAEILRLEWDEVDLEGGHIEVSAAKAKTAQRRLIPIQPCLQAWLQPLVKPEGRVADFSSAPTLAESLMTTAKKAKVPWKKNALRHSYASYRLAETADAARVSLELGNTPQMVFRHYRELVRPVDAAKWFALTPKAKGDV